MAETDVGISHILAETDFGIDHIAMDNSLIACFALWLDCLYVYISALREVVRGYILSHNSQNATALAAATLRLSTWCFIGMRTV